MNLVSLTFSENIGKYHDGFMKYHFGTSTWVQNLGKSQYAYHYNNLIYLSCKPGNGLTKWILGLHVKIPENYFKILEEGKNVGKFIFSRSVKIPENEPRKRKNPGKFFRK